jgi:excisionase family DNA binding protein
MQENKIYGVRLLTTADAGKLLGVSSRRVLALIRSGSLKAEKAGRDWLIDPRDLKAVRVRTPGRPKKTP